MRPLDPSLKRIGRSASAVLVILATLTAAGCSQHSAFIRYNEYTDVVLQPEPFEGKDLGPVRVTEGGALWKECTNVARGSLWLLVEEARRRGGNAVGDLRWMPQSSGGTLEQPTCKRRWGVALFWPLLLTPAFMAANVEGTVYLIDEAAAESAGLYLLPDSPAELAQFASKAFGSSTGFEDSSSYITPSQER